jgi:ABC-type phosphate transport system substrate-binding protein
MMRTPHLLRRLAALLCAATLLAGAGAACASELVVVVSARSPVVTLRPEQVAAIFLGQTLRFPDGVEAIPLDQRVGSPLRDDFYARVAGKTPALLKAYWSKMVFTGRGQPPAEVADSAAMRRRVAENPESIGYIDRSALDASVRPVLVLQ